MTSCCKYKFRIWRVLIFIIYFNTFLSDNCSSGQSSQACTPNDEEGYKGASAQLGSDNKVSTCPSSQNNFHVDSNTMSHQTSNQLSPTKTLIQKFNNIGVGKNISSQTQRQQPLQFERYLFGCAFQILLGPIRLYDFYLCINILILKSYFYL